MIGFQFIGRSWLISDWILKKIISSDLNQRFVIMREEHVTSSSRRSLINRLFVCVITILFFLNDIHRHYSARVTEIENLCISKIKAIGNT